MNARALVTARQSQWHGSSGMISCPLPSHGRGEGDRNPSCRVWDGPSGICFHCFGGCDWRDIKAELRRLGLLPEFEGRSATPCTRRPSPPPPEDTTATERRESALEIWRGATAITETVGEIYLRQVRKITIELPPTTRYHAAA